MSTTISTRLGQELIRAVRRPRPASHCFAQLETRQLFNRPVFLSGTAFQHTHSRPHLKSSTNPRRLRSLPVLAAGGGLITLLFTAFQPASHHPIEIPSEVTPPPPERTPTSGQRSGVPSYHLSQIKEHGPKSERPWVTYGDKVYDITDWIPAHPGGEVILRAAGGSIEPYWNIFAIHKTQYVLDILDQYVVGRIHPDDLENGRPRMEHIEDPFETDPVRDKRLRKITEKPCNAETSGDELSEHFLTPNEVFYVRNHMWVPSVEEKEADGHGITVELPDGDTRTYTIGELKSRFEQHTVTAVLQCSGNRRNDMTRYAKKTNGLQWTVGAISCAKWEGVRLRDVLRDAGLSLSDPGEDARHVQFTGQEAYGASIPITSAIDPMGDVLLAFRMNDEPLPRDHGFPVRVIVPGHVAARCVKWVNKIVVSDEESSTSWQRKDYKCFGPNETTQDWDKYKSIQVMPITSAITRTRLKPISRAQADTRNAQGHPSDSVGGRAIQLDGYAYSGGGREIQRVDVSLDGGETWDQARLVDDTKLEKGSKAWCWKRWRYEGTLPTVAPNAKGEVKTTFVVKATDDAYNTQPETHKSIYNLRGNLATAWHRVDFDCAASPADCEKTNAQN
ncbi:Oxidoreductase, molybdopterin-binding domain-containing protein [Xylariomycetidae sp. FL2044]|nr:Oxidoreductase, molybdopterin-binding domain-containing protein [Xylariomycetidae sp. FL2044]